MRRRGKGRAGLRYMAKPPRLSRLRGGRAASSIMVIEDLDDPLGFGAFWGEVQSNIHKALGCLGVVTNGSIRDIPMIAPGFQMLAGSLSPSHAFTHVEDFGIPADGARHEGEQRRPDPR